jgi:hypothetical protein
MYKYNLLLVFISNIEMKIIFMYNKNEKERAIN